MDINLMVLNVGNSRLAIGIFSAGTLEYVTRSPISQQADWPAIIEQAWARIATEETPAVAAAGVNPALEPVVNAVVKKATGQSVRWVGRDIDLPIPVKTESPDKTGGDRVLNVAAAYEQMEKACIVVDAGTAVTVDCCNDAGEFLGGAIFPGVNMMLEALHEKTAQLPRVTFAVPTHSPATSTADAISLGIFSGIRGLVRDLAENYAMTLGSWPEIIATGGDAQQLFADWELIHAVSPDLTLYGIALAYTNHQIKLDS